MNANLKKLAAAVAILGASVSGSANAASATDTVAAYSIPLNLNLQIVIPGFLYFRVGPDSGVEDTIVFTVPAANVGNSTPVAGTGGDAGAGSNVVVRGNNGQVTLTVSAVAGGGNGLGTGTGSDGYINYNTITTNSTNANLPAPVMANAPGATSAPVLGCDVACAGLGKVTNRSSVWSFSYANATVPSAGNYTGQVTYTASTP